MKSNSRMPPYISMRLKKPKIRMFFGEKYRNRRELIGRTRAFFKILFSFFIFR